MEHIRRSAVGALVRILVPPTSAFICLTSNLILYFMKTNKCLAEDVTPRSIVLNFTVDLSKVTFTTSMYAENNFSATT